MRPVDVRPGEGAAPQPNVAVADPARPSPTRLLWTPAVVVAALVLDRLLSNPQVLDAYYFRILELMGIAIIMSVSLNLINGFAGQFSIGHAGFEAVGGYSGAAFTYFLGGARATEASAFGQALWMLGALVVGAVAAALAGLVVGVPSLRLRGDYLAIVTLGFGEIIRVVIQNINAVGGASGFSGIPGLTRFYMIALVAAGAVAVSRNLLISTHGRAMLSVREDEIAATALGVNTTRYKVLAFVLGSAMAGMAGVLLAHLNMSLDPLSFGFLASFEVVIMVILGGTGSTTGAVLGAVFVTMLPEALRFMGSLSDYRMVFYSILLILLMLVRPRGILGGRELTWHGIRATLRRRPQENANP